MSNDNTCWFCGSDAGDNSKTYQKLIQNPQTNKNERRQIDVPCCVSCEAVHKKAIKTFLIWFISISLVGFGIAIAMTMDSLSSYSGRGSVLGVALALPGVILAMIVAIILFKRVYSKAGIKSVKEGLQHPLVLNASIESSVPAKPVSQVKVALFTISGIVAIFGLVAVVMMVLR